MGQQKKILLERTSIGVIFMTLMSGAGNLQAAVSGLEIEEIVITAQKKETILRKTAMSVSAIQGNMLEKQQISSLEGLAQLMPNVNFGQTTGNARIAIRGVGFDNISLGNEGRAAFHNDGIYISRPAASLASFYDVERVEVLRGPQGTLYGRNATGGAINIISRKPTAETEGYIDATVGNYSLFKGEGAIGGALGEKISGRLSFQVVERGGYGENVITGRDIDDQSTQAFRAQINFEPSDSLSILLSADYFHEDDAAYSFHYLGQGSLPDAEVGWPGLTPVGVALGADITPDLRDTGADSGPDNNREFWGMAATIDYELDGFSITSITSYRSSYFNTITDLDGTSTPFTIYDQIEDADQFSQELRISGSFEGGDWMVGGYYFDEEVLAGTRIALPPNLFLILGGVPGAVPTSFSQGFYGVGLVDTKAYAVFANVSFDLSSDLTVKVGGRYSHEKKSIDETNKLDLATPYPPFVSFNPSTPPGGRQVDEHSWSSFTPTVTVEYRPTDDVFAYLTFSRGFKSGGYNVGNLQAPFAPETLSDFEGGIRIDWADGAITTDFSVFYYDYSNLQVSKVNGLVITIENAANAKIWGLEAELNAQISENFRFNAALALLDTKYEGYVSSDPARPLRGQIDLSGNELIQAPHYTLNLEAIYTVPTDMGEFTLIGQARFVGDVFFTSYNLDHVGQPAYELFNAYLSWEHPDGVWHATAYIKNIANDDILSAGLVSSTLAGAPFVGAFEPPRTFGVTVGYRL